MSFSWLESLLYGFISGLTEFLPVSSRAHQQILLHLLGKDVRDPVRDLLILIALLLSLFTVCRPTIEQFRRDNIAFSRRRRQVKITQRSLLDLKLVKNATVPMLIGIILLSFLYKGSSNLLSICLFLLINGALIFLSCRMIQGNKDSRSMTQFDSLLIGISGALSVFPGISRITCTTMSAIMRGADKNQALNWSLLISIPAIILFAVLELTAAFTNSPAINIGANLLGYVLSALGAYIGGYLSIKLMKLISYNVGLQGFAYYSWGTALYTFIIYLTVV